MPSDIAVSTSLPESHAMRGMGDPQPAPVSAGGPIFVLDFRRHSNGAIYRTSGWSGQEDHYVWSVGPSSTLWLPGVFSAQTLTIETDLTVCQSPTGLNTAIVRVIANDHIIGSALVSGWTRLRCHLPARLIAPGKPITLRYEHPNFVRLDFMEPDRDDRPLGLCFYAVRLFPSFLTDAMQRFAPPSPSGRIVEAHPPAVDAGQDTVESNSIYRFAAERDGAQFLVHGWRHDPQGDAWAHERICKLRLPAPKYAGAYIARFDLTPLFIRRTLSWQRITILLGGAVLGQFRLSQETSLAIELPHELVEPGGTLEFALVMPDGMAMHPFDGAGKPHFLSLLLDAVVIETLPPRIAPAARVRDDDVSIPAALFTSARFLDEPVETLPQAIRSATGLDVIAILRNFESLGDNCSFGLAQQKAGCDTMSLLRFGATPLPNLLKALDDEFNALNDPAELSLRTIGETYKELSLFADRYGIRWHTGVNRGEAEDSKVLMDQTTRLRFLRRKFYEALRAGRKIYAVARAEPRKHPIPLPFASEPTEWEEPSDRLRLQEVLPLFSRLNQYGTNTLLYMTRCANGRRSGTVELLAPGIMRGYVDDFVISPDPTKQDHTAWLRVAANAWLLDTGPNAPFKRKAG